MTSITQEKSAAMTVVEELRDLALKVKGMPIPAGERAQVFAVLAETVEALAATANDAGSAVYEETPAGGTLGTPDGWLPPAGRAQTSLDEAGRCLVWARDAFNDAVAAVEDMAQEARSEQADDTLNGGHP
ncbi:hypothetical protein [Streptosporangium vulgare]|uniref:Uncharacterized protein n=1 Tax=Streptosporangium vulgare TaxID=46190 RepID=A0ABV5TQA6_9ACTN